MPTYSYKCESCGVVFDKFQSFSDKPLTRCPDCRKGSVRRILQPAAIVFKGSGWYATDHRSPSGQTSASTEAENKTETSTATPAAGDDKPAKAKKSKAAKSDD